MATFLLIHGAGSDSWDWHRVAPLLVAAGHQVHAPDLPCADDSAGFEEYARAALASLPDEVVEPVVVVGHSMGAFTAVLACEQLTGSALVLVAPMIPAPGETGGQWWAATEQEEAQKAFAQEQGRDPQAPMDSIETFLHDVEPRIVEVGIAHFRDQSGTPFTTAWAGPEWPAERTMVIVGRDDRLFPLPFQRRVCQERLGIEPVVVPSGHMPALACPDELAAHLLAAANEAGPQTLRPQTPKHQSTKLQGVAPS
ncbi:alpha/beta fold hydrolase [Hoyosella sp. G463]|uniref:Alpha/beta fold hydrolase n=1 Tax=Lolliginicoccus lacisalsi TaxID=2742202 RepID=A0A927JAV1_9ACTN|nr:alpha/beta fold hydrolase [Lolliginicoccus lacisalsi]MBD8505032.1 alpha/beta fold hydrolase [Lolliginicoccus lacisalsi]